jgi:two-component system, LuxR family, response regulator FixJ
VDAIKQGAFDFVEKPFDDERLMARIQAAIESGQRMRIEHEEKTNLSKRMSELSPRQVEVMDLVVEGLSNKEIALKLQISPRTVENYRAWVMEKMGANNLADLVRKVMVLKG